MGKPDKNSLRKKRKRGLTKGSDFDNISKLTLRDGRQERKKVEKVLDKRNARGYTIKARL